MTPDQLVLLAILFPAALGAPYLANTFAKLGRPALLGAVIGALVGAAGSLIFLLPIDFCTFEADRNNIDRYLGLFLAGAGGAVALFAAHWLSATFLRNDQPVSLGGQRTPGMFGGWIAPWLLLIPSLIILVSFLYYPALQTFRMSVFNTRLGGRSERMVCVDNFARLMNENGFRWEVLGMFVLIVLGFIAIRLLHRNDEIGRGAQIVAGAMLLYFLYLNLSPMVAGALIVGFALWLAGQDRESWGQWIGYAFALMLTILLFQEVLAEILSSRSTNNYYRVVTNTFYMSGFIVVISLVMSLAIAYVAYQPIRGGNIYRTLLIWPYAISPPVAGIIFNIIFNPEAGLANHMIRSFGFDAVAWRSPQMAPWTIIMASVWKSLGFSILFYIAGLQNIPKDLVEAAAIDGANAWQRFTRIVVPMLSPITFFLIITTITYAFFDIFGTIDYLTSGGPAGASTVMIYAIYDTFNDDHLGRAAAQSIVLFLLVIAITYAQFRTTGRRVTYGA